MSKNERKDITRSSAAEYLTFIAANGDGGVEVVYANEDIWATQKMMATLYQIDVRTINYHLKNIFNDNELEENSVIQDFRITATDGKNYNTKHYNLSAVIAVGYKVNSERAVQFRKWATQIVQEFTIKGYVMDDERLVILHEPLVILHEPLVILHELLVILHERLVILHEPLVILHEPLVILHEVAESTRYCE